MRALKFGDRVIINYNGKKGTVKHISNKSTIGIEFDEFIGGHNLNGNCKDGYGWYYAYDIKKHFNPYEITLIKNFPEDLEI